MLKALGWIAGATFNLLWAQTIDSMSSCQYPRPLNKNIKLKAQTK
uniref:ORF44i n=1 Tax=Pinus koraiensis TaxID=88728 RepID=A4QM83_PINKO|nr:ORF44i [Pinus koraiensis]